MIKYEDGDSAVEQESSLKLCKAKSEKSAKKVKKTKSHDEKKDIAEQRRKTIQLLRENHNTVLPKTWTITVKRRAAGSYKGSLDRTFRSPEGQYFNSMVQVAAYCDQQKKKKQLQQRRKRMQEEQLKLQLLKEAQAKKRKALKARQEKIEKSTARENRKRSTRKEGAIETEKVEIGA